MPVFLASIAAKVGAFFAKGAVKWITIGIVVLAVLATVYAGYRYVVNLQEANATLAADKARLQGDLTAAQTATLKNFQAYEDTLDRANRQTEVIDALFANKTDLEKRLKVGRDWIAKKAAEPSGDGPIAQSLEEALNALRQVKP